jgi:hypothetical protein
MRERHQFRARAALWPPLFCMNGTERVFRLTLFFLQEALDTAM